jgi:HD domain
VITPDEAAELAKQLHEGQRDKVGRPYFLHVDEVATAVRDARGTNDQIVAAYLHDAVEDTEATVESLRAAGVQAPALEMIRALTHCEGEPRASYMKRVVACKGAILVKQCDLWSNLTPSRLVALDPATQARLLAKYAADVGRIGEALR